MKQKILLSYGSGGKYTYEFIKNHILKNFSNPILNQLLDAAVVEVGNKKIAFSTDSYTVNPIFFAGGDIGKLSICGTINDLLCVGAIPFFISLSLIIEEGMEIETIQKILSSIEEISKKENILIVTGDTKVVNKGNCDKLFINTAGIGIVKEKIKLSYERIEPEDVIIINGCIAEHGLAVLLSRGGYGFSCKVESDCVSLKSLVETILKEEYIPHLKFMRDPTRGGVACVLNEIVEQRKDIGIEIEEQKIPIKEEVKNLCEILSFEPLNVANEGKIIFIVDKNKADEILSIIKTHPLGKDAQIIGKVTKENPGRVILKTIYGAKRIIEMPIGEEFPRIC